MATTKKMTKKELKAIEEANRKAYNAKITLRRNFLDELHSYWKDVEATSRYYQINQIKDKVKWNGSLNESEKKKLFERYETLKEVAKYDGKRDWEAIHTINSTDNVYHGDYDRFGTKYQTPIKENTLIIDDIIWDQEQFDKTIELARKFGYTEVLYIDSSTACAENMARFAKIGSQILGTNAKMSNWGLRKDEEWRVDKEGIVLSIPEM